MLMQYIISNNKIKIKIKIDVCGLVWFDLVLKT
jgi:hypothetical protein